MTTFISDMGTNLITGAFGFGGVFLDFRGFCLGFGAGSSMAFRKAGLRTISSLVKMPPIDVNSISEWSGFFT